MALLALGAVVGDVVQAFLKARVARQATWPTHGTLTRTRALFLAQRAVLLLCRIAVSMTRIHAAINHCLALEIRRRLVLARSNARLVLHIAQRLISTSKEKEKGGEDKGEDEERTKREKEKKISTWLCTLPPRLMQSSLRT